MKTALIYVALIGLILLGVILALFIIQVLRDKYYQTFKPEEVPRTSAVTILTALYFLGMSIYCFTIDNEYGFAGFLCATVATMMRETRTYIKVK